MNFLDIGIFMVLFYNIVSGLKKGLIRCVFEVLALLGGIFFSVFYYSNMATFLSDVLQIPFVYATVIGFVLIWSIIFLIITILGQFLHQFLTFSILGWVNYLCGGILGFLKGFFILLLFVSPMFYFNFPPVESSFFLKSSSPVFYYFMKNWLPIELFSANFAKNTLDLKRPEIKANEVPRDNPTKINNQNQQTKQKELERLLKKNNLNSKNF
jgi:uncharacterized membrane protein required for colicin V production